MPLNSDGVRPEKTARRPQSLEGVLVVQLVAGEISPVTRASLAGAYHDSVGNIRTLDVTGRDVNVQASGTLALNDTGQSNLKIHADSPSLEQIGKLR